MDPERIWKLMEKTLYERCPPTVTMRVTRGHSARPYVVVPPGRTNTPPDQSPRLAAAFAAANEGVKDVFGRAPLYLREGGSIAVIADIKTILGLDSLMLGITLPEDGLHAPNESFHLGLMEKGIRVSQRILSGIAAAG
jgi:acetylornithine deacetylase/succinyl-diaminopimelate desuccinylase-like protein